MIPDSKLSTFIAYLISDTKSETVIWEITNPKRIDSLENDQSRMGKVYECEYKNKSLRLYKYSESIQIDEFDFRRMSFIKLEFTEVNGDNVWSFPINLRELTDLYETVQIKTSGLDSFFDELIPDTVNF